MSKKIVDLILISAVIFAVVGCASGGGSAGIAIQTPTPPAPPTTNTETDKRYIFDEFNYSWETIYGDVSMSYTTAPFSPSSNFPSNDKYKIADYGFLRTIITGTHTGDSTVANEETNPGPWNNYGRWFEANLNGDEHVDLIYVGQPVGSREWVPESLMLTFINDGEGHYKLASELFENNTFPCVWGGGNIDAKTDPYDKCGFQQGLTNGKIVADFNGDGISDYYDTSVLYLSINGVLQNKSYSNLPDMFFDTRYGPLFVHDAYAGNLDNDNDLDIFVPVFDRTQVGYLWGGDLDPCTGCNQPIPWTMLINDGNGNFTANHNINMPKPFQDNNGEFHWLWATTAAIGDFDNDGFGDIAVGWYNPGEANLYGFSVNSSGVVYFNDGKNDWRNRPYVELPTNFFGANGNANDMEVLDFDGDGWLDIILAVTTHEPYYRGRVIQFFKNNNGQSFSDVTSSLHPAYQTYAEGNDNNYWVGQGTLTVVDFDHDGDLDIVDTTANTYVLLNDNGVFTWYQNFVDVDDDKLLWPVEIDGKYQYDFIGSTVNCNSTNDQCTTDFFQVLDPPFVEMLNDIKSKPQGYISAIFESKMLLDDVRKHSRSTNIVYKSQNNSSLLGYSFNGEEFGVFVASLNGDNQGGIIGVDFQRNNVHSGYYYVSNTVSATNKTKWYGTGLADVEYSSLVSFTEWSKLLQNNLFFTSGYTMNYNKVKSFTEKDSTVNVKVNGFNFFDLSVFVDFDYLIKSRFGLSHFSFTTEYFTTADTKHVNFADVLRYNFSNEDIINTVSFTHKYKMFYLTASKDNNNIESYEIGFNLKF